MLAVTGVQNGAVHLLRQQVHGTGMRVAHNQQIRMHRVQRQGCVDQGLPLFDRGRLHRHIHHIRPQTFARQFKTGLRAGGVFKEHVDLGQPLQRVRMFLLAPVQINILIRQIQNGGDLHRMQGLDPQKMLLRKRHDPLQCSCRPLIETPYASRKKPPFFLAKISRGEVPWHRGAAPLK